MPSVLPHEFTAGWPKRWPTARKNLAVYTLADMPLPLACIVDLGSNAIRFLVACPNQEGQFDVLHRDRRPVRIGDSVFTTGKVGDEAQRIIDTIHHFQRVGRKFADKTTGAALQWLVVATSALREANDRDQVVQRVKSATRIDIKILSGEQEAELALRSVTAVRPLPGPFLVADLGGGSLELILGQDSQMLRCSSFQLGAVRWQKAVDSANTDALDSIQQEIHRLRTFTANHRARTCIGLGGAFRAMHQVAAKRELNNTLLQQWRSVLAPLSPDARNQRFAIPQDRADIILPAIDALSLTLEAVQGTAWTQVEGVGGIADGLAQYIIQSQVDQKDRPHWFEISL